MLDFCVTGCFRYLNVLRTLAVPRPAHSGSGFPTVPEMPACRPDEFYADQHLAD